MKTFSNIYCNALITTIIGIALTGCMNYGNLTESNYAGQSSGYGRSESFYMLFEGESINFDFETLGAVKTVSNRTDSDTEVLERMAYEGWNRGANAIIYITSSTEERSEGTIDLLPDSECEEDEEETVIYYDAVVFEGVSVYVHITDEFIAQHGAGIDLTYVKTVETDLRKESNSKAFQGVFTVIGGLLSLVVAIAGGDSED